MSEFDLDFLNQIVGKGGPKSTDFQSLREWVDKAWLLRRTGRLNDEDIARMRMILGAALSPSCLQGLAFSKVRGYAGDFEVIDRMYTHFKSPREDLQCWDDFIHEVSAVKAVRNRKSYFLELLSTTDRKDESLARVLEIGSGPGRGIAEWFHAHPNSQITFKCIELDKEAIAYAEGLNQHCLDRVSFVNANALFYKPTETYDLIWAAGIFDYFPDKLFVRMTKRLLACLKDSGLLVVGNFSDENPTRSYMELITDWHLEHRSPQKLTELALLAGAEESKISVNKEPEGVNLFLHVRK